jgi:hypothetical protein
MMGAGGARKVTGEELEMELSEPATPVVLDVYAQVRSVWFGCCFGFGFGSDGGEGRPRPACLSSSSLLSQQRCD